MFADDRAAGDRVLGVAARIPGMETPRPGVARGRHGRLEIQGYRLRNMGLGRAPSPSRTASAIRSGRSAVSGSSVMSRRR